MSFTNPEGMGWLADLSNVTNGLLTLRSAAQVRPEVTVAPWDRA